MSLIDEAFTREQFDYLDAEVAGQLLAAISHDLGAWTDRLMAAWDAGDSEAMRLARHEIRGVCSNFGARRLWEMAETDMTSAAAREAYRALTLATVSAIRKVAGPPIAE